MVNRLTKFKSLDDKMKMKDHKKRAEEFEKGMNQHETNTAPYINDLWASTMHYIQYGCQKKFGEHKDTHAGLSRFLREKKEEKIAETWEKLEAIRQSWTYGAKRRKNNPYKYLKRIKKWATEK